MSTMRMFNTGLSVPATTPEEQEKVQRLLLAEQKELEVAKATLQQLTVLHSKEEIQIQIDHMALQIAELMKDEDYVVVTSLRNSDVFAQALKTSLNQIGQIPKTDRICFMRNAQDGTPELVTPPGLDLAGRKVIILKSLVKGGVTTDYAKTYCKSLHAKEVYVAALMDCPNQREAGFEEVKPDFVCVTDLAKKEEAKQMVGCGLGMKRLRTLSFVGVMPESKQAELKRVPVQRASKLFKVAPLTIAEILKIEESLAESKEELAQSRAIFKKLRIYLSEKEIETKLDEIADKIALAMKDKPNLVLMACLMGALPFAEKIKSRLNKRGLYPEMDVIYVSRYGNEEHGGHPELLVTPRLDLRERDVLILEDLIEGGPTMEYSKQVCRDLGAKSVQIAALLDKVNQRVAGFEHIQPEFCGFLDTAQKGGSKWLIGGGCDQKKRIRDIPDICFNPLGNDPTDDERPQPDYVSYYSKG